MNSTEFNVLFMPRSEENPYQSSLVESLRDSGHNVWIEGGYPISFVKGILENGIPDIIHIHWLSTYLIGNSMVTTILKSTVFGLCAIIARVLGIKLVWTVHNLAEHEQRNPMWEEFIKSVYSSYIFNRIIVHCSSAVNLVQEKFGCEESKVDVIPHANYINLYPDTVSEKQARTELEIDRDKTVFLHFGKIREYKRVTWLIRNFSGVSDEDALFLIAGSPETEEIEEEVLARENNCNRIITDLRFIPEDEIQYYLRAADAMVLGFNKVLTSGSAVLAMSFGVPIVSPRLGCLPDIISERGGFLYENDNPDKLVEAIECALESDLKSAGDANFQRAKRFSWSRMAELTTDCYSQAIK
ncbi:glycosyltransferase family 4 protein [Halorubrum halodurans]|nr:glycosyltransferase family 4 protein [Halorubrum halodurans]